MQRVLSKTEAVFTVQSATTDTNPVQRHTFVWRIGDSNKSKAASARWTSSNNGGRMWLSWVACFHFFVHRQESEAEKQKKIKETTGVPVSLQNSLSELSHMKCTNTHTHTRVSVCWYSKYLSCQSVRLIKKMCIKIWKNIWEGKKGPSVPTCTHLYMGIHVKWC